MYSKVAKELRNQNVKITLKKNPLAASGFPVATSRLPFTASEVPLAASGIPLKATKFIFSCSKDSKWPETKKIIKIKKK